MSAELSDLRAEIDEIDAQLVRLVERRMDVAARVAEYKKQHSLPVLDKTREQEKLEALARACSNPCMGEYIKRLYAQMFAISRDYQSALLERV